MNLASRMASALGFAIVVSCGLATTSAHAYDRRQTAQGKPIRWNADRVVFVVDPGVEKRIPGAREVIGEVVESWSERSGGPTLATSFAQGPLKAAVDGVNAVLIAPPGFAGLGSALAITLTTYDETTGGIVDTDIVINGDKTFAILTPGARARLGAPHVVTDGAPLPGPDAGPTRAFGPFDFPHVFGHEVGHALGLGDSPSSPYSLMYAYTIPGDASARAPTSDDVDGVAAQYAPTSSHPAEGGCNSSVSGSRTHTRNGMPFLALALLCGTIVALRRAPFLARARARVSLADLKRKAR